MSSIITNKFIKSTKIFSKNKVPTLIKQLFVLGMFLFLNKQKLALTSLISHKLVICHSSLTLILIFSNIFVEDICSPTRLKLYKVKVHVYSVHRCVLRSNTVLN